ncbi:hypothetical protein GCM10010978_07090 [Compostibacillus humi]|uniref:Uncharacterized protein n=1 Tax=Compostibacillus humi TaxID=1245525 RepID=A0A8J2ZPR8_9BACI|nr:hypothetical protein GCM10010978_07090 [Compostibacillus humi]
MQENAEKLVEALNIRLGALESARTAENGEKPLEKTREKLNFSEYR